jgi:hypothetical protein
VSYYSPQGTPPTLPARKREAARRQLEQVVTRSARRRWRWPGVAAAAGAVIVLSTGAVTYAHYQRVTNKTDARCYTVASTVGGDHYTTVAAAGLPGRPGRVEDALSVCGDLWREGFLRTGASGIARPDGNPVRYRVPPLVVCTMADGTAAVFPGSGDTCAKLGLATAARP